MNRHLNVYRNHTLFATFVCALFLTILTNVCYSLELPKLDLTCQSSCYFEDTSKYNGVIVDWIVSDNQFVLASDIDLDDSNIEYGGPWFYYYQIENSFGTSILPFFHLDLYPDVVVTSGYLDVNLNSGVVSELSGVTSLEPVNDYPLLPFEEIQFDPANLFFTNCVFTLAPEDPGLLQPSFYMSGAETPPVPAVPEPSVYGLMLVGMAVLRWARKKHA